MQISQRSGETNNEGNNRIIELLHRNNQLLEGLMRDGIGVRKQ